MTSLLSWQHSRLHDYRVQCTKFIGLVKVVLCWRHVKFSLKMIYLCLSVQKQIAQDTTHCPQVNNQQVSWARSLSLDKSHLNLQTIIAVYLRASDWVIGLQIWPGLMVCRNLHSRCIQTPWKESKLGAMQTNPLTDFGWILYLSTRNEVTTKLFKIITSNYRQIWRPN